MSNFYLRDKFLSLDAVNVSRHIKGSNDIENIISASKSTIIENNYGEVYKVIADATYT